jgi:hypothetical protein
MKDPERAAYIDVGDSLKEEVSCPPVRTPKFHEGSIRRQREGAVAG